MKNIKNFAIPVILAVIAGFIFGYNHDQLNSANPAEFFVSSIENFNASPKNVFRRTWRIIKNNYVDETYNHQNWERWKDRYKNNIKTDEDARVAAETMLASLNDPYTRFLTEKDFEEQNRSIDSKLQGIGVHITEVDGVVVIISVIEDTPAEKYGLKEKDKILKVDNVSTKGLTLREVAEIVRGEKDTMVKLTISRNGKIMTKNIKREEIKIKTVKYRMLDNNIAYIRITSFISHDTTDELKKALIETQDADGIILDVRGNYGGLLSNAVYISNMFLDSGNIVSIVDRNKNKRSYDADSFGYKTSKPLVMLINESSASASEILSGAIKDNNRGTLIGETTFGKGLVQMIVELPGGAGLNFTIAKYLTPSGTDINEKGIEPNIVVDDDDHEFLEDNDIQLNKAIEVLLEQLKKEKAA